MILILSHIHGNLGGKSLTGEYESGVNVFENRGATPSAYSHRFYQMDYAWLGRSETIYFCPFIKYTKERNALSPKISNINKPVTFCCHLLEALGPVGFFPRLVRESTSLTNFSSAITKHFLVPEFHEKQPNLTILTSFFIPEFIGIAYSDMFDF